MVHQITGVDWDWPHRQTGEQLIVPKQQSPSPTKNKRPGQVDLAPCTHEGKAEWAAESVAARQ